MTTPSAATVFFSMPKLLQRWFKLAKLSFWPIGATVDTDFGAHPIANVIWLIFGGIGLALGYLFVGVLWCITIIGIPFGKQCFKLAKLAATPFGAKVA